MKNDDEVCIPSLSSILLAVYVLGIQNVKTTDFWCLLRCFKAGSWKFWHCESSTTNPKVFIKLVLSTLFNSYYLSKIFLLKKEEKKLRKIYFRQKCYPKLIFRTNVPNSLKINSLKNQSSYFLKVISFKAFLNSCFFGGSKDL